MQPAGCMSAGPADGGACFFVQGHQTRLSAIIDPARCKPGFAGDGSVDRPSIRIGHTNVLGTTQEINSSGNW